MRLYQKIKGFSRIALVQGNLSSQYINVNINDFCNFEIKNEPAKWFPLFADLKVMMKRAWQYTVQVDSDFIGFKAVLIFDKNL